MSSFSLNGHLNAAGDYAGIIAMQIQLRSRETDTRSLAFTITHVTGVLAT